MACAGLIFAADLAGKYAEAIPTNSAIASGMNQLAEPKATGTGIYWRSRTIIMWAHNVPTTPAAAVTIAASSINSWAI